MPKSPALRSSLWGLNRARLLTAAIVLAVGALLRFTEAVPYAFGTFAMTVLGGAAACLVLPLGERRGVPPERIAWFQFGLDALVITAIVTATGGPQSVFIPLYVLLVVASCFVLSGRGGLAVAGICSLLYVLPVLGRTIVPMLKVGAPSENTALEILTVFMNAGVLLAVAVVTGALAERYHELQEHMEDQRKHLSDLQAFRDLIFESVGSGLVGVDPNGRVTAFNRAAVSITGVRAEDAIDQAWEAIFGDGVDLAEVRRAVSEGSEPAPRYEFRLRRHDGGQEVPVGISFWSLRSGTGDVAGLIGVCQDLSSIKQMEQRMRQADRLAAVGRLSANMAHEIRNPLASISGAVEALARDLPPDHTRSQLVEIVLRESARLNQIVGDFLEYARPAPMAAIEINMAEIFDEVLLLIEHRTLPANLKVSREYGETLPTRADPQRLRQAVWNLCLNAVQAMPDGGELRVGARSLRERGGRLQISITDTGQGIAETDLPHIFEPFFSTKPEGSGIGLALVYRVVEEHGGSIEVRSRVGEGTTFVLTLPAPGGVARE